MQLWWCFARITAIENTHQFSIFFRDFYYGPGKYCDIISTVKRRLTPFPYCMYSGLRLVELDSLVCIIFILDIFANGSAIQSFFYILKVRIMLCIKLISLLFTISPSAWYNQYRIIWILFRIDYLNNTMQLKNIVFNHCILPIDSAIDIVKFCHLSMVRI